MLSCKQIKRHKYWMIDMKNHLEEVVLDLFYSNMWRFTLDSVLT